MSAVSSPVGFVGSARAAGLTVVTTRPRATLGIPRRKITSVVRSFRRKVANAWKSLGKCAVAKSGGAKSGLAMRNAQSECRGRDGCVHSPRAAPAEIGRGECD